MKFGVGQSVLRKEDPKFLTGRGKYVDDIVLARMTHAVFVFSPVAHADIRSIDTSAAEAAPGVVAVLTGKDYVADGMGPLMPGMMPEDMGGPKGHRTSRWPMPHDRVRYVGERVAMVIAETEAQARDAAALVEVDYAELPAVARTADAVKDGAAQLYAEAPKNIGFTLKMGNEDAVEPAFARAAHVSKMTLYNNRLSATPMEMRGCIGEYDRGSERYTLYSSTQHVHGVRAGLANNVLKVPESRIRVIARDVGGGFGMKTHCYPDEALVTWAARRIDRPVKWISTRSESLFVDGQGRDQTVDAELALDADGKFLAMRWKATHGVGAYIEGSGAVPVLFSLKLSSTVYDIPAVSVLSHAVFTNTPPTVPYRGAGRPEAVYIMERLIDQAAREMKIDRVDLRRRNFVTSAAMPYANKTGWILDTGDYAKALDKASGIADMQGYEARRKASEAAGKKRGLGLVYYVDNTGIFNERMEIRFDPSGGATVYSGVLSHGQGHATSFAQMVTEWLGIPFENIRLVQADTDEIAVGRGTYASRSMMVGGSALRAAADDVIEKGKKFAAHFMEADVADIEFADGQFTIAGTDKMMPLAQIAAMSFMPVHIPAELGVGLQGVGAFTPDVPSFPNGCHICEVEIDPETGAVTVERYTVVDDIGTVINPLLAQGQIHGGVVQGIGQALFEDVVHDSETAQLLSGSLMDYGMPRADHMPHIAVDFSPVPSKSNPLGVKGVGEGGTVAGTPAVMNAVVDALAPMGVRDVQMPATPLHVWQAIEAAA
jgi:aerobic carbon-monoxide dehydrogenase large subunit